MSRVSVARPQRWHRMPAGIGMSREPIDYHSSGPLVDICDELDGLTKNLGMLAAAAEGLQARAADCGVDVEGLELLASHAVAAWRKADKVLSDAQVFYGDTQLVTDMHASRDARNWSQGTAD